MDICSQILGGRQVTGAYNLGLATVIRRLKVKDCGLVKEVTVTPKIPLRYERRIWVLTRDDFFEQCTKQLIRIFGAEEKYTEYTIAATERIPTGRYCRVQYKITVPLVEAQSFRLYEVKIKTFWIPNGLRYQPVLTRAQLDFCTNPFVETDPIIRRKLLRTGISIAREIQNHRTGNVPPFITNIMNNWIDQIKIVLKQEITVFPNGHHEFIIFLNDPFTHNIDLWPNRIQQGLQLMIDEHPDENSGEDT